MQRLIREGSLGWKLPSTTHTLLPLSSDGANPSTFISTLTDLELRSESTLWKEEGWNHEHTRRPFSGMALFLFCEIR